MDDVQADNLIPMEPLSMERAFEDLSVLDLIGLLLVQPRQTINALGELVRSHAEAEAHGMELSESEAAAVRVARTRRAAPVVPTRQVTIEINWAALVPTLILAAICLVALIGSFIVESSREEDTTQPLLIGGIMLVIGAVGVSVLAARNVVMPRFPPLEPIAPLPDQPETEVLEPLPDQPVAKAAKEKRRFWAVYGLRIGLFIVTLIWTVGSWLFNSDNEFTAVGVLCWIMSMITLTAALSDYEINWAEWLIDRAKAFRRRLMGTIQLRFTWTTIALIVIVLVGAWFRFSNLSQYPPDMTSDHVEKLLDSIRVYNGARDVFFANNGGREAFQFYYLPVLKSITGLPWSFELLKIGSGLEGMVMILMAWWMGRAIFGEDDRELGNLVGLLMAALIATSFWHTLLSRLGLRIVTTCLVVTFVMVFLIRAIRYNRRLDFLIAGFGLGAGMYFYQAVRMLPLVVIAGFVIALLMRARTRRIARQYTFNLIALILISLAVFVPLGRYMQQTPEEFWNRTAGRLFGEATTTDSSGKIISIPFDQRFASFKQNLPVLADNMLKSVLMFNWRGDGSWFNGSPPQYPALDVFAGMLFVVGLGILLIRMARRRDPADVLLPISILIMLLPSALAIAFPIEVPGFTRGSGSLPMVYLVAAFGLAMILQTTWKWATSVSARRIVIGVVIVLLLMGAVSNANAYFVDTMADYRDSSLPYRQAGSILRGFIDSTGAPGNAFIVAYKYWWDHRALAIEAGDLNWANTLPDPDHLPDEITNLMKGNEGTPYALQPDRQLMFFLNQEDKNGMAVISKMFPDGTAIKIKSYNTTRDFYIYVAPPRGCDWMRVNLQIVSPSCAPASTPAPDTGTDQ